MKPLTISEQVNFVLDSEIRPLLHFHGGDIEIAGVSEDGTVSLEYIGACHGCVLQSVTHFVTVRQRLLKLEGVTDVVARGVRVSEAAIQRIAAACAV